MSLYNYSPVSFSFGWVLPNDVFYYYHTTFLEFWLYLTMYGWRFVISVSTVLLKKLTFQLQSYLANCTPWPSGTISGVLIILYTSRNMWHNYFYLHYGMHHRYIYNSRTNPCGPDARSSIFWAYHWHRHRMPTSGRWRSPIGTCTSPRGAECSPTAPSQ